MKIKLPTTSKQYQELLSLTDPSLPMKLRKKMLRNIIKRNKDKSMDELVLHQKLMDKSFKEQRPFSDVLTEYQTQQNNRII